MEIANDIVLRFGDGEIVLVNYGARAWTLQAKDAKQERTPVEQQHDFAAHIKSIKGLTIGGEPLTVEHFKAGDLPFEFFNKLAVRYFKALSGENEAEAKNAPTTVS